MHQVPSLPANDTQYSHLTRNIHYQLMTEQISKLNY